MKTQFVFAAVLTVAALTGTITTSALSAYAYDGGDESETNTEQELKQKNVGSGDSTNNNCGENLIQARGGVECFNGRDGDGNGDGDQGDCPNGFIEVSADPLACLAVLPTTTDCPTGFIEVDASPLLCLVVGTG
jgi:hypothetical protein